VDRGAGRQAGKTQPSCNWFLRFSAVHRIIGPLVQSTLLVGVLMILGAWRVQFRHPGFLIAPGIPLFVVTSLSAYTYNNWRVRRDGGTPRAVDSPVVGTKSSDTY
jgi:hypothetical protein